MEFLIGDTLWRTGDSLNVQKSYPQVVWRTLISRTHIDTGVVHDKFSFLASDKQIIMFRLLEATADPQSTGFPHPSHTGGVVSPFHFKPNQRFSYFSVRFFHIPHRNRGRFGARYDYDEFRK